MGSERRSYGDAYRPTRGGQSKEGPREYGDVAFADPTNHKYPVDTPEHVRAAWSYINHLDNASKYDKDEVKTIKERIKRAAKKHGVEIEAD
jgi:hypothetical protein